MVTNRWGEGEKKKERKRGMEAKRKGHMRIAVLILTSGKLNKKQGAKVLGDSWNKGAAEAGVSRCWSGLTWR